jgi:hypothetical protein
MLLHSGSQGTDKQGVDQMSISAVIYVVAGCFAFTGVVCAKGRAAGPAALFVAISLVLFAITPAGLFVAGIIGPHLERLAAGK